MLDADGVWKMKLEVGRLAREECGKVIGEDLDIEDVSIKKLVNFKEICREKPRTEWGGLWKKYQM